MGKLVLVTGGARSGKSTFAEKLVSENGGSVLYIATAIPFDDEMRDRIQKHTERRLGHWQTVEAYTDLDRHIASGVNGKAAIMLDCITVMVSNIMLESGVDWDKPDKDDIRAVEELVNNEVGKLLDCVRYVGIPCVIVANEVGMGIVPDNLISRVFRDIAGRINQTLARSADEVYLCVSGIPVKIK